MFSPLLIPTTQTVHKHPFHLKFIRFLIIDWWSCSSSFVPWFISLNHHKNSSNLRFYWSLPKDYFRAISTALKLDFKSRRECPSLWWCLLVVFNQALKRLLVIFHFLYVNLVISFDFCHMQMSFGYSINYGFYLSR